MSNGETGHGMSLIVKTVTRWLKPFIFLFGVYVVLYGHVSPGGGFAGGVVIACALILLTLAEGQLLANRIVNVNVASVLAVFGAILFLGAALSGMVWGRTFLHNFASHDATVEAGFLSGGLIELCEIAIGIIVGMSLYLAFCRLSAFRVDGKGEE